MNGRLCVSYRATIDEATDAGFRLAELSGAVAKQKGVGLCFGPVFFIVFYWLFPSFGDSRLLMSILVSVLFMVFHLLSYRRLLRKQIRKMTVKMLGTEEPVESTYELSCTGLLFRRMGHEIKFDWSTVISVTETDRAIELVTEPTGIAIIPKRVLGDPGDVSTWIEYIEEHTASSLLPGERSL